MKFKVDVHGQEKEIEVTRQGDRLRVERDDKVTELRVVYTDGAHFVLEYEQPAGDYRQRRRLRAAGHLEGDKRHLWVNGSTIDYKRMRQQAVAAGASAGSLSASIPAVVSELLVEKGAEVTAGEKLILLESMKMILPIVAPHNGIVRAINCSAGESVRPGVPLIELDEA